MLGGELMMDRREKAVGLKHNGHNCCQAVLCAFADELPLAEEDLNCIGAAYGEGGAGWRRTLILGKSNTV